MIVGSALSFGFCDVLLRHLLLVYALTRVIVFDDTTARTACSSVGIVAGGSFADIITRIVVMAAIDDVIPFQLSSNLSTWFALLADDVQFTALGSEREVAHHGPCIVMKLKQSMQSQDLRVSVAPGKLAALPDNLQTP